MKTMIYGVQIQTGNGAWGVLSGWDTAYHTRVQAEECARRAAKNDGWQARVIEMTADEAKENGWL